MVKASFELANALRRAGLVAEFNFCGSQLPARWSVTVTDRPKGFIIRDESKGIDKKVTKLNEVIDIIGGFGKLGK